MVSLILVTRLQCQEIYFVETNDKKGFLNLLKQKPSIPSLFPLSPYQLLAVKEIVRVNDKWHHVIINTASIKCI